jgi:hypothetical protein
MRTRALLPLLHSLLPLVALLVAGSGALSGPSAQPVALPPPQELLRGIYKELAPPASSATSTTSARTGATSASSCDRCTRARTTSIAS